MFEAFDRIEAHGVASKPIPAECDVGGSFLRDEHHFIYWYRLSNGDTGIVTMLHERLHQTDRFRDESVGW